jgi:hypothetical protein
MGFTSKGSEESTPGIPGWAWMPTLVATRPTINIPAQVRFLARL